MGACSVDGAVWLQCKGGMQEIGVSLDLLFLSLIPQEGGAVDLLNSGIFGVVDWRETQRTVACCGGRWLLIYAG